MTEMVTSGLMRGCWRRSDGPLEGDTRPKRGETAWPRTPCTPPRQRPTLLVVGFEHREEAERIQDGYRLALVAGPQAPQPDAPSVVGTDGAIHRPVASTRAYLSPLSPRPLRRCHPRQEPDAVMPHVRICGGGYEQSSSLLRPTTVPGGVTGFAGADRLCAPRERLVNLVALLRGPSEALLPGPSERPKADVIPPVVRHLLDGGDDFTTPPRLLTRGANVVRLLLRGRLVGLVHQAVGRMSFRGQAP